ncbi:hypothetical protein GCM10010869_73080 [Mesorhizobium tianshanense]|uniref:Pseudoazurin n=1 Tax=Mesorhizobium tianshanense TaxID=39844 RepID=A0A562MWE2_9HYPH|nr:plastocyanin/azurin family copper-binding protein [Mesorhizobium tianshanense]TWI24108.1 pseudoazurin [Mesorhizobium tianshanense]GLS41711.1 hypothetical protein GCM10010869_73080 [Mesorhizobium tianshanense]
MRLQILTLFLSLATSSACAETHDIKMLNRNETGPMVYEPDFVQIAPGDTVKFIAAASGHNAATIDGMVPDGHPDFKGNVAWQLTARMRSFPYSFPFNRKNLIDMILKLTASVRRTGVCQPVRSASRRRS